MLAIPGLCRASPVSWLARRVTRSGLSRKWDVLVVRSCSTQQETQKSSSKPNAGKPVMFQSPFQDGLDGLAALVALSGSGRTLGRDEHGDIVIRDVTSGEVSEKGGEKTLTRAEEKKSIRSPKVKKVPTPEPRYSKAARRFFNMRFRKAQRLSKVMAAAGVASRRACEEIIFAGKVVVNGKVCKTPETHVDPLKDMIYINGRTIPRRLPPKMVFAVYKPKGYICSDGKDDTKTVYLLLERYLKTWEKNNPGITKPRFFTVGRLDVGTTGLLFITNDGEFAQKVSHPSSGITKEYIVTVGEKVTKNQLKRIAEGTEIEGALCVPLSVELLAAEPGDSRKRLRVVVSEGRHHEVRKLVENAFLQVHSLKRVRVGGLRLPSKLSLGGYIQLTEAQIKQVTDQDPILLETGQAPPAITSGSSKALIPKAETPERYPLLTERKEVRAVIETSTSRLDMMERVQRMVPKARCRKPTRRVRPLIFKA